MTYYDETHFYGLFGGHNTPNGVGPIANGVISAPIDFTYPYESVSCDGTVCFVHNANVTRGIDLASLAFPAPLDADDLPAGSTPGATTIGDLSPAPDFMQVYIQLATLEYHGYNNEGSCELDGSCGPFREWLGASIRVNGGTGGFREQIDGFTNTEGTLQSGLTRSGVDPTPLAANPPMPARTYTMPGWGLFLPSTVAYDPDPDSYDFENVAVDTLWGSGELPSVSIEVLTGGFSGIMATNIPGAYHPLSVGAETVAVSIGVRPFWLLGAGEEPPTDQFLMLVV